MLTEKYRPKLSEIVGNQKALVRLEKCVGEKTPCLLYGAPGSGKTSSVYAVAEKLGLRVAETNASDERKKDDLKNILRKARMKGFRGFLILLDEVDGLREAGMVTRIMDESIHPIVFTANELYKVPSLIQGKCEKIRFYNPTLTDVLSRVKVVTGKEGIRPKYDEISRDVRASINTAVYGGETYKAESDFEKVQDIFRGKPVERVDRQFLIWLVDNCSRFYDGRRLYEVMQIITETDRTGRMELLRLLPKGKYANARYPFFLRRLKVMRSGTSQG